MPKCLNDITADDLAEVKKLAAVFFSPEEIALILEIDAAAFESACKDGSSDVYNAFQGGVLLSEYELRASVLKLAKAGSSPAQSMSLEMVKMLKVKLM